MKKFTLIIIALISFQVLQAQQEKQSLEHPYIPLVVENAHWLQNSFYTVDDIFYESDTFDYKIEGDTIISSINYKKCIGVIFIIQELKVQLVLLLLVQIIFLLR